MAFGREDKLAHVNKSPETVAVHDKDAWLDIFASDAVVEDPVGSNPHHNRPDEKNNPLSGFYDTFIEPNEISFNPSQDYVCDMHVVRDLSVTTRMGDVEVEVPMHLLYELVEENGELKIQRLAAHWELVPMVSMLMKKGLMAAPVIATLSARMLKNQGIMGTLGFSSGAHLVGSRTKRIAEQFVLAFNRGDADAISSLFDRGAVIEAPHGKPGVVPGDIFSVMAGQIAPSKILVAGDTVSCSISWVDGEGNEKPGVAIFTFDHGSKNIHQLSFYFE